MYKKLALFLSFLLLCYCIAPLAYADVAATQTTATATPTTTSTATPQSTVTSDTYLADQLTDLKSSSKDDKKKINSLLKMEVIDTATIDTFGVDQQITRGQIAKTIAIILGLRIDTLLKWEDPSHVYIEALKGAGIIIDETDTFNSSSQVTRQQLAMLLIKGLGLDEKAKAETPGKDETVDTRYQSYVAYAIKQKIMSNQKDGNFGGITPVTKKEFALAAYEALQLHTTTAKPAKASIAEVKLLGTGKISVRLNRDVDSNKAILNITKYGSDAPLSSSTVWADDETSATLETSDVLTYGKYTVDLSGLDASSMDQNKIDFISEVGTIQELKILTSTEKLPKAVVRIDFEATNKYGDKVILSPNDLKITISDADRTSSDINYVEFYPGENAFSFDLSKVVTDKTGNTDKKINILLIDQRSFKSASKQFIIGDIQLVSKIEIGDLKIPGGQLIFKAGVRAYLKLKAYDQNGFPILDPEILNKGVVRTFESSGNVIVQAPGGYDFIDFDYDGYPELQIEASMNLDGDKEVIVNLFCAGEKASTTITVTALKTPATVLIKPLAEPAAEGDGEKMFGLVIKDSTGYEFTSSEIVEAETTGRISVYATGGIVLEADTPTRTDLNTGVVRQVAIRSTDGQIRAKAFTAAGPATINVRMNAINTTETLYLNIEKPRKPTRVKLDAESSVSVTLFNGVKPSTTFRIYDQYDAEYTTSLIDYKVIMVLERINGSLGAIASTSGAVALTDSAPVLVKEINQIAGKSITVTPHTSLKGSYRLTANLAYLDSVQNTIENIDTLSVELNVVDIKTADLVYWLDIGDGLNAAGKLYYDWGNTTSVTNATYLFGNTSYKLAGKDIVVGVKDSSGYKVSYTPKVKWVAVSNPNIIAFNGDPASPKFIGINEGKTTLKVFFDTPLGQKDLSMEYPISAEPMDVTELKINQASPKTVSGGATLALNGLFVWDTKLMGQIQVVSNYGSFVNQNCTVSPSCPTGYQDQITPVNNILQAKMWVSDIVYKTGTAAAQQDTIAIGNDFKIAYTRVGSASSNNIKQFTINFASQDQYKTFIAVLQTE